MGFEGPDVNNLRLKKKKKSRCKRVQWNVTIVKKRRRYEGVVKLDDQMSPNNECVRYLGSIIHKDVNIERKKLYRKASLFIYFDSQRLLFCLISLPLTWYSFLWVLVSAEHIKEWDITEFDIMGV